MLKLLIVVGIVAILVSILVSGLAHARELGRRTKCMANQRTLGQAVHGFANEHNGFGQLFAPQHSEAGYRPDRYVYEPLVPGYVVPSVPPPATGARRTYPGLAPSPWPVAYGSYIGAPTLKSERFFIGTYGGGANPNAATGRSGSRSTPSADENADRKEEVPVLLCPSDKDPIGNLFLPYDARARISYSINIDIFGAPFYSGEIWVLRGTSWAGDAPSRDPLAGNLDRVSRPSEVAMFVDGGISKAIDPPPFFKRMAFLSVWGPTLSHYTKSGWLPDRRHGSKGGLVSVYADGHAQYLRPIEWTIDPTSRQRYPSRYSPDPRMTPYKVAFKDDTSRRR